MFFNTYNEQKQGKKKVKKTKSTGRKATSLDKRPAALSTPIRKKKSKKLRGKGVAIKSSEEKKTQEQPVSLTTPNSDEKEELSNAEAQSPDAGKGVLAQLPDSPTKTSKEPLNRHSSKW